MGESVCVRASIFVLLYSRKTSKMEHLKRALKRQVVGAGHVGERLRVRVDDQH